MTVTTKTPVDSIVIPKRFVDVCGSWYNGRGDLLYAVFSSGNLTTGNRRPSSCNSHEKWYLILWQGLASDIGHAVRSVSDYDYGRAAGQDAAYPLFDDYSLLVEFKAYVDEIVDRLSAEYGLNG